MCLCLILETSLSPHVSLFNTGNIFESTCISLILETSLPSPRVSLFNSAAGSWGCFVSNDGIVRED